MTLDWQKVREAAAKFVTASGLDSDTREHNRKCRN